MNSARTGIFKESKEQGTEEEEGYRTGPPGYIGWRNSFLGIDSGAPYTFKNTGSHELINWNRLGNRNVFSTVQIDRQYSIYKCRII